jgi:hypothetical protein
VGQQLCVCHIFKALRARQWDGARPGGHNNTKNVPMQPYMAREPKQKKTQQGALNNSHKKT